MPKPANLCCQQWDSWNVSLPKEAFHLRAGTVCKRLVIIEMGRAFPVQVLYVGHSPRPVASMR